MIEKGPLVLTRNRKVRNLVDAPTSILLAANYILHLLICNKNDGNWSFFQLISTYVALYLSDYISIIIINLMRKLDWLTLKDWHLPFVCSWGSRIETDWINFQDKLTSLSRTSCVITCIITRAVYYIILAREPQQHHWEFLIAHKSVTVLSLPN